ncbi:MAG: hypothetical protein PVJ92_02595, partial [Candidatus Dependentiae bacterium]
MQNLGAMESTPDAQFLGFTTQWRVRYRFTSLAIAIAPLVDAQGVTIYHAERMDQPTRLFFSILSHYISPGSVRLIMGHSKQRHCETRTTTYLQPEESHLIELLSKEELTGEEQDDLVRYGTACALVAN